MFLIPLLGLALASEPRPAADAPGEAMPTRTWDVEHLHLDLRLSPDDRTVRGTSTHKVAPLPRASSTIRLHQIALDISEVRVDGAVVEGWRAGGDFLEIPLGPSVPHEITVAYSATPETGLHFRGERGGPDAVREVWSQGEGEDHRHWFPSWDYPNDRFTFSIDLTVPSDLNAQANGELRDKVEVEPGWTRWSYVMDHPIVNYLVAVGVGEYRVWDLEGARIPMQVIAPRSLSREQAVGGFDRAVDMLPFFDDLLGTPYPYPNYRQLIVQRFLYSGMENTTLTLMAEDLVADRPYKTTEQAESVNAHELAHQWFGDLLTCYGWRELWLNEGFATYYTNRWWEHSRGEPYAAARRRGLYDAGLASTRPMAARSWSPKNDRPNAAVYTRGATVLHGLSVHLGREVYDEAIQRYVAQNQDRLVETDDLRRVLEDTSGEHLGWFFDAWVHGAGAPSFRVSHRMHAGSQGDPGRLEVTLRQTTEGVVWQAPVEIEIGTTDGVLTRKIWVGEGAAVLELELDEPPRWVLADPRRAVLAHWTQHQRPAQWIAAAKDSPSWDGRLQAIVALGEAGASPEVHEALISFIDDDSLEVKVRELAAMSLGKLESAEASKALVTHLSDPDFKVRRFAAEALRPFAGDPTTIRAVERVVRRDPHPEVAGSALSTLGEIDKGKALEQARRLLRRRAGPDDEPRLVRAAWVLAAHGDLSDLDLLVRWLDTRTARDVLLAAAQATGRLLERHHDHNDIDRARRRASTALIPSLDSPDLRTRRTAVFALGRAGDETAGHALRKLAASTTLPTLADYARDSARKIRSRDRSGPEEPVKSDLQELRDRLDAAEKRLEELERWR
ncbi:MAG: hypothetical protein EA397_03045 [Deltaproteobacteria bacterium]|nr:MAG: hypothetical protein EA397_03045 [Deltaproteobacteria bacterium]